MATGRPVPCGIAIPQVFNEGPVDVPLLQTFLTRAEGLGYDSAWVQERIIGKEAVLEPITLLSYAAALTRTLRLGTSVLLPVLRNPIQLAKSLSSLDQLSGGRLIVGVGLGGQTADYSAFGISPERRVRRFVEGLAVVKALWTQPTVEFAGEFWCLQGIALEPKPVQRPHPPLWFGARQPAALRRAVRLGDGFMGAGSSSSSDFKVHSEMLRTFLDEAKRDPATFSFSKRVYIAVDPNKARAEQRLRTWFGIHYRSADMASQVAVWGSVAECLDGLNKVVAYGAQHLLLNPAFEHLEHIELLAKEIMPHLTTS